MPKPQRGLNWLEAIIDEHRSSKNFYKADKIVLVGVRGYFRDSMGKPGVNDRGIFDDGFFWINLETGWFAAWNGNTDPSTYRKGSGSGSKKGIASLNPGCWRYKMGMHNGSVPHAAFRQADRVEITRDGAPNYADALKESINIHRGSKSGGTSSLGCQTVPYLQWADFKETGYRILKMAKQETFPYILVEKQG